MEPTKLLFEISLGRKSSVSTNLKMSAQGYKLNNLYLQCIQIANPRQFYWNCALKIVGRKIPKEDRHNAMKQ